MDTSLELIANAARRILSAIDAHTIAFAEQNLKGIQISLDPQVIIDLRDAVELLDEEDSIPESFGTHQYHDIG